MVETNGTRDIWWKTYGKRGREMVEKCRRQMVEETWSMRGHVEGKWKRRTREG